MYLLISLLKFLILLLIDSPVKSDLTTVKLYLIRISLID